MNESYDLAGVVVGETRISHVEGEAGQLSYRGLPIDLFVQETFERQVWFLLFGVYPTDSETEQLRVFIRAQGRLSTADIELLHALPKVHPMQMLQALTPLLAHDQVVGLTGDAEADAGLAIAAKIPSLIAAWYRLENAQTPLPSNDALGFYENFLVQFHGRAIPSGHVDVLHAVQALQMEHSFNAGTFAGRVCASTEAPLASSISCSIGTLYGRLHGGADQAAMEMARKIGDATNAKAWVEASLRNGEKIMGMGHREYRVVDPRALILKPMAAGLCTDGDAKRLFETLVAVESACQEQFARKGKEIYANVEFYKGAVFNALGIPAHFYTAMFAMARVFGYVAHYLEFRENRRLIRPTARYVG